MHCHAGCCVCEQAGSYTSFKMQHSSDSAAGKDTPPSLVHDANRTSTSKVHFQAPILSSDPSPVKYYSLVTSATPVEQPTSPANKANHPQAASVAAVLSPSGIVANTENAMTSNLSNQPSGDPLTPGAAGTPLVSLSQPSCNPPAVDSLQIGNKLEVYLSPQMVNAWKLRAEPVTLQLEVDSKLQHQQVPFKATLAKYGTAGLRLTVPRDMLGLLEGKFHRGWRRFLEGPLLLIASTRPGRRMWLNECLVRIKANTKVILRWF